MGAEGGVLRQPRPRSLVACGRRRAKTPGKERVPHVVEERPAADRLQLAVRNAQRTREAHRHRCHPGSVTGSERFLLLDERRRRREKRLRLLDPPAQLADPGEGAHPGDELPRIDRLVEEVVRPDVQTEDLVRHLRQGRQHGDRNPGRPPVRLEGPADREAVHGGHHHVEENAVGQPLLHCPERREAVRGRRDLEALLPQDLLDQVEVLGLVVDDENAVRGAHRFPPRERTWALTASAKVDTSTGLAM